MGDEEHVALPQGSEHVVGDGLRVLVRPLVAADRAELAAGYRKLSSRSRHTRFFAPPEELDEDDLDYLTLLDYDDHYALAAFALDAPGRPGIGVARYVRERDCPSHAEVAVTVLDGYQRRGLGTLLMRLLACDRGDARCQHVRLLRAVGERGDDRRAARGRSAGLAGRGRRGAHRARPARRR